MTETLKYLIYVLGIVFIIGVVLNLAVTPFIDNGISPETNPTYMTTKMKDIVNTGNVFNLTNITINLPFVDWSPSIPVFNIFTTFGEDGKNFIITQITIIEYLPTIISIPLLIIFVLVIAWALYELIMLLLSAIVGLFT